ncbi:MULTISPECIES: Ig domain-containing protein [unclassified Mesorhizobium]|uniref:Ig domain-containing protein n=1 Tax=unclassified Mesorhizobium TaxID=325217 RepID=UPI00333AF6EB
MSFMADQIFDSGLAFVTSHANRLHMCSDEPATYAEAVSLSLGHKDSPTVSSPSPFNSGRKVTISAFTDGVFTAAGRVTHWALVDSVNSVLLGTNTLAVPKNCNDDGFFTSPAFLIAIRGENDVALSISGGPVTLATKDQAYAGFVVSGRGGTPPYAYSVFSGSLPDGLALNASTGAVSGTPTTAGSFDDIVIRVTDDDGSVANLGAFNIEVLAWVATASLTFEADSLGGQTVRIRIASAQIGTGGTQVRVTLMASTSHGGADIVGAFVGIAGTAAAYATTPTRLTFNGGSSGVSLGQGSSIVTDNVAFSTAPGDDIIIGLSFDSSSAARGTGSQLGWDTYIKAAFDDAGNISGSGYFGAAWGVICITKIEGF